MNDYLKKVLHFKKAVTHKHVYNACATCWQVSFESVHSRYQWIY